LELSFVATAFSGVLVGSTTVVVASDAVDAVLGEEAVAAEDCGEELEGVDEARRKV
jgi:hypothetical protein